MFSCSHNSDTSLSHLVPAVGSPCDGDGACVACLHAAFDGLHNEALLLQGRHVVPVKLTTLENHRKVFLVQRDKFVSSVSDNSSMVMFLVLFWHSDAKFIAAL